MATDIFQSRRNYNEYCRWWTRNENDDEIDESELKMNRTATGSFCAKEMSPIQLNAMNLGGVFRIDGTHTTIKSPDDLGNIKVDDYIEYQGEIWRVDDVQQTKAKLQNTYYADNKNCSHFWYIALRK